MEDRIRKYRKTGPVFKIRFNPSGSDLQLSDPACSFSDTFRIGHTEPVKLDGSGTFASIRQDTIFGSGSVSRIRFSGYLRSNAGFLMSAFDCLSILSTGKLDPVVQSHTS